MNKIKSVCIYCGSKTGNNHLYKTFALELGKKLAKKNFCLVYGGGDSGIMGAVSKGARDAGGHVLSVIPEFLINKELSIENLKKQDDVIITQTMHQRKNILYEKAQAFIVLPGGMGTLEEVCEMLTWAQLGQHKKPIILANFLNFWQPLLDLIDHMQNEGFITNLSDFKPHVANDIDEIICLLTKALV